MAILPSMEGTVFNTLRPYLLIFARPRRGEVREMLAVLSDVSRAGHNLIHETEHDDLP